MVTADVERVAEAIRAYLAKHPDAADSVEGVARWWLPVIGLLADIESTEAALVLLARRGLVQRLRAPDGRVMYSRAEQFSQ